MTERVRMSFKVKEFPVGSPLSWWVPTPIAMKPLIEFSTEHYECILKQVNENSPSVLQAEKSRKD
jgi:hypothetical protein